jgi:hypothetical protein
MALEILLAIAQNISSFFWFIATASGVVLVVLSVALAVCSEGSGDHSKTPEANKDIATVGKIWWRVFILLIISITIGSLPKVDDLWKIRVSMIKLYLASPENIKAGSETIERIAKRLECQYIGCKEDKKETPVKE